MNLFYQPNIDQEDSQVLFDKEESRHIIKVLRKQSGDLLNITNGKGFFFKAILANDNPKQCKATIQEITKQNPMPYELHLAVAPTKLNDRYEWFLEKATEIGITQITPIVCDHSERKVLKNERLKKIVLGAMKQSVKAFLPELNPMISFKEFITQNHSESLKCIAHCEDLKKNQLKDVVRKHETTLILIGPEGDFSVSEIEKALKSGFIPVSLGNSRLRTETAAIVATHSVAFINEV